jgi:hypothetical protein
MGIPWEKVVTDPLGLTAYALSLVFGIVSFEARRRKLKYQWVVPAGFAMAAVCVLGGLSLAYLREAGANLKANAPNPSLHIDKLEQKVGNGNAVAGVQGDVKITPPSASDDPKAKQ